jgi:hypothetical protein
VRDATIVGRDVAGAVIGEAAQRDGALRRGAAVLLIAEHDKMERRVGERAGRVQGLHEDGA